MFRKFCFRSYSSTIKPLSISHILKKKAAGETIKINGWIKSLRKMKEHVFFDVNDGSSSKSLQVLLENSKSIGGLSSGTSIVATGQLSLSPKGQLELNADNLEICGKCELTEGYPFSLKKTYEAEYLRQYLHLRPRTSKFSSLLRVRDAATRSIHDFFSVNDYIFINAPILTSNDCEGAGEVFQVVPDNEQTVRSMSKANKPLNEVYFNSKVYLTVSGQLHLEAAAHSLSNVYTLGPTFRAENSKSRLHLSEFYMLEAESAFVDKLEDILKLVENLIKDASGKILHKCSCDVAQCSETKVDYRWINESFVIMTYDEAVAVLNQNKDKYQTNFSEKNGLVKEHELFLVDFCNGIPVFVINWPKQLKPFYMRDCVDDNTKVAAFDLLVPNVGELVGGSLRENSYDRLKNKLPAGRRDLDWYLEIRKFGGVPTGGFGLGFERYLQFLLGITNIKDTIPFPRWPHNCKL